MTMNYNGLQIDSNVRINPFNLQDQSCGYEAEGSVFQKQVKPHKASLWMKLAEASMSEKNSPMKLLARVAGKLPFTKPYLKQQLTELQSAQQAKCEFLSQQKKSLYEGNKGLQREIDSHKEQMGKLICKSLTEKMNIAWTESKAIVKMIINQGLEKTLESIESLRLLDETEQRYLESQRKLIKKLESEQESKIVKYADACLKLDKENDYRLLIEEETSKLSKSEMPETISSVLKEDLKTKSDTSIDSDGDSGIVSDGE